MRMFSRGASMDDGHAAPVEDEEQRLLKGSITAYEVVNFFPQEQLSDIIYQVRSKTLCLSRKNSLRPFTRAMHCNTMQRSEMQGKKKKKKSARLSHEIPNVVWRGTLLPQDRRGHRPSTPGAAAGDHV